MLETVKTTYCAAVDFSRIEDFDFSNVFLGLLATLGLSGGILSLMAAVSVLGSWAGAARLTVRGINKGVDTGRLLARQRPVRGAISLTLTVLVPAAQALTLGLCYLGGNYISLIFDHDRVAVVNRTLSESNLAIDSDDVLKSLSTEWIAEAYTTITGLLEFDAISGVYVVVAAILVVLSYGWTRDDGKLTFAGTVVGLPGGVLLGLGLLGGVAFICVGAFVLVVGLLNVPFEGWGYLLDMAGTLVVTALPLLLGIAISGLYFWACTSAVRGSRVLVQSWSAVGSAPAPVPTP
ncbi:MAG: hypothetical protein H0T54_06310 [Geodermatophilaceae bacterium]|nr:hypothetical protein [Geodermatophilaceae bacterium]